MKYVRRLMWFLASRILVVTLLISILVCAFYLCMDSANIYVVVSDGMEKRVDVVLTREDSSELSNYFHTDFLNADPVLNVAFTESSPYINYTITDYDYTLSVESLWAWPWDSTATCRVVERVPSITGSVISSRKSEASETIPSWQGGRYELTLIKVGGQWKISGMKQLTAFVENTQTAEPTAAPTPTPAPTEAAE